MNLTQAIKMAAKSISSNKGRSALTMLGIIIGIAAVMTIVSAINGYTEKTMEQYEAMGSNKLTVNIWNYLYDEDGNSLGQDYFPALYDYCNSIKEYVLGVTPQAYCNATVVYGTKSTANMSYNYDENGNLTGDVPPSIYYGSDQYSICNNLTLASGRALSVLDIRGYKQVCVLGDRAAKIFFDAADPVGKVLQLNGQSFEVVGVYAPRLTGESASASQIDNVIILPYTARRVLVYVLDKALKLLHPFMPFVTEELYQALPGSAETIMTQAWPTVDEAHNWPEEEEAFEKVMDYIKAVRTMRTEMNVHPAKKTSMIIETADATPFQNAQVYLAKFAFATEVTFTAKYEGSTDGMVQVSTHAARGFIPMMELIDREKELARLNKEKAKAEKELAMFENQLANPKFVERAPAALVEEIRAKRTNSQSKLANIEQSIKALG